MKICLVLFLLGICLPASAASWTDYRRVASIQSYGGGSFQVWLDGLRCPNVKPYFSVDAAKIDGAENFLSLVLMAKASQTRIIFFVDTESHPTFCYVKGIRLE